MIASRLISLVGLLALMGLAWVFSKHRSSVRWRTVVWGVGLQLLFALIILGKGGLSFTGMFLFGSLVGLYLTENDLLAKGWSRPVAALLVLASGGAIAATARAVSASGVTLAVGILLVLVAIGAGVTHRDSVRRWAVALLLPTTVGFLWQRGIEGKQIFQVLSDKVAAFLSLSNNGAEFLFGNLAKNAYFFVDPTSGWPGFGFQFAFTVLPTIIFFSAFMGVMYYLGVVQVLIRTMSHFMHWSLKTSGSETMSVSGNIFVGQTESPLLVRPFLDRMTVSELHAVMVGGFATIAGGVLAGYIQMGVNPGHLIAASVMSAPAALVIAKLLYPETEVSETAGEIEIPEVSRADNIVEAAADGTTDGLKLALNVGAMLLAFIALIAVVDSLLGWLDHVIDGSFLGWLYASTEWGWLASLGVGTSSESGQLPGIVPGSLATLFGTVLAPLAWIMGVPWKDAAIVGNLLGVKLTVTEFVAYGLLARDLEVMDPRSGIIATYALCGFANFSSIGIQIGGIGALAPERRAELASIGLRAMIGGAFASWMTATIAGILL